MSEHLQLCVSIYPIPCHHNWDEVSARETESEIGSSGGETTSMIESVFAGEYGSLGESIGGDPAKKKK